MVHRVVKHGVDVPFELRELLALDVQFEGMYFEEVGLRVEKASSSDCLVGVEGVLLSEFCEGELFFVIFDPVPKSGHGYFCLVSSAHGSYSHIQGIAHVVVGECGEDEFWWIGGVTELTIRKALLAGFA